MNHKKEAKEATSVGAEDIIATAKPTTGKLVISKPVKSIGIGALIGGAALALGAGVVAATGVGAVAAGALYYMKK